MVGAGNARPEWEQTGGRRCLSIVKLVENWLRRKRLGMRGWKAGMVVGLALLGLAMQAGAQVEVENRANALFNEGKRVDALPLYEQLAKAPLVPAML